MHRSRGAISTANHHGKGLFADGAAPATLRLTNSTTYPSGTLHVTYETTGAPIRHTAG